MKTLLLLFTLFSIARLRTFTKCELAHVFQGYGLGGLRGYRLEDSVCLVQCESGFKTDAVGRSWGNGRVSTDYGLFQINSPWWCDDGQMKHSRNGCGQPCSHFMDDNIADDIRCAKRVVREPQGMNAWYGWRNHCRGNLDNYLLECHL
ncbi:lysozyme C, milk isozyme-like [Rhinoraja longicauda]